MSDTLLNQPLLVGKVRSALICSDVHLSDSNPSLTQHFLNWLDRQFFTKPNDAAPEALIILGDLFDAWIGDDQLESPGCEQCALETVAQIRKLTSMGTQVFFMHGNRDFLLGGGFEKATGAKLIQDPSWIKCAGETIALGHGDAWCTADTDYQAFRNQVRDPRWQSQFLQQSLDQRRAIALGLRSRSEHKKTAKSMAIMDVAPEAIDQFMNELMSKFNARVLIHGHTHRPARHDLAYGRERWVLPDWETNDEGALVRGGGLLVDDKGISGQAVSLLRSA